MKFGFILIFVTLFTACEKGDDFVYYDDPPFRENYSQSFTVLVEDKKVDILWVIDNSGSMMQIQSNIEKNTALFMQAFKENKDIEWKMGLVSTDKSERPYIGFNPIVPFDHTSLDPVSEFQSAVSKLGTSGSASEYTFFNVDRMISKPSSGTDYSHFFREDAHLVVIMVSDELEQSDDIDAKLYKPQNFLNHLRNYKAANRVIRFYGAFDFKGLAACSSWTNYKGSTFEEMINLTKGFHISACESTFGSNLAAIGNDIVSILKTPSLPLNQRPRVNTIEIRYKGDVLPGGPPPPIGVGTWFYDRINNAISFYNLDFAEGGLEEADINVTFEIDDGVDREDEI